MPSSNNNNKDLQLQGSSRSAVKQFPELTLFSLFLMSLSDFHIKSGHMYLSCIVQFFDSEILCLFVFLEYNHLLAVKHNLVELSLK
jgi:hypothetical protein